MRRTYRRRSYSVGRFQLPAIAWVGVCLAVAVVTTVIVGNVLKKNLDPDLLDRLSGQNGEAETEESVLHNPYRRRIQAAGFAFGEDLSSVGGKDEISVCLNRADGKCCYRSSVAEELGLCEEGLPDFYDTMDHLCATVSYISGVYDTNAFSAETSDLFYARMMRDRALIREFFRAGGSDIVLCSLPSSPTESNDVKVYLKAFAEIAGNAPIGVAVTPEEITGATGGTYLETLLSVCDFLVLDLRGIPAEELDAKIGEYRFYVQSYSMRLMTDVPVASDDYQAVR